MRNAISASDVLSVRFLLAAGADPTGLSDYEACYHKHGFGQEPMSHLVMASFASDLEIVTQLVLAGADINAQEGEGQTALWMAASHGRIEIVRYLVSVGARQDIKGEGMTPVEIAQKRGHETIVKLLNQQTNG